MSVLNYKTAFILSNQTPNQVLIRAVDRQRLVKKLGTVAPETSKAVSAVLVEMFTVGKGGR